MAQYLVWLGLVPSFLSRGQAEAIGVLGALVVAIVIRMAGATGEKKEQAEALLAHQALHDMLTGLPNRAFFYERTEEALEPERRPTDPAARSCCSTSTGSRRSTTPWATGTATGC